MAVVVSRAEGQGEQRHIVACKQRVAGGVRLRAERCAGASRRGEALLGGRRVSGRRHRARAPHLPRSQSYCSVRSASRVSSSSRSCALRWLAYLTAFTRSPDAPSERRNVFLYIVHTTDYCNVDSFRGLGAHFSAFIPLLLFWNSNPADLY